MNFFYHIQGMPTNANCRDIITSWVMMLVLFSVMLRANSQHVTVTQVMSHWRASSECTVRVASSVKSNS